MDVKWLLAGGFALWSIATGVAGLVHGYAALFVARLVLGAGESVAYPSYSRILSHHFTEEQRGWPNAVISAGFSFGLASGLFFGGMLVGRIGWRPFFIGLCGTQPALADPVAAGDAADARARGRRCRQVSDGAGNPRAARVPRDGARPLLRELLQLHAAHVAAEVSRRGAPLHDGPDGRHRRHDVHRGRAVFDGVRTPRRRADQGGPQHAAHPQDDCRPAASRSPRCRCSSSRGRRSRH